MSLPDHELMESAAVDTTISASVSPPPPRDSMEDADPSLTRKRPRLDSSGVEIPAMHVNASTQPDSAQHTTASAEQVEMTIRSQPPSSSHARNTATNTGHPDALEVPNEDISAYAAMDGASKDAGDASADSPPVIAIDDDEDADDADPMNPYAEAASFHVEYDPDAHLSMFPFANEGDYIQAAQEIARYFHSNQALEGDVLNQLSEWLDGLPDEPSAWLGFYVSQAVLWEEICVVAGRILNRRYPFNMAVGAYVILIRAGFLSVIPSPVAPCLRKILSPSSLHHTFDLSYASRKLTRACLPSGPLTNLSQMPFYLTSICAM